jgi:hypothetical protein
MGGANVERCGGRMKPLHPYFTKFKKNKDVRFQNRRKGETKNRF